MVLPVTFGLPFAPPEMVERLLEQKVPEPVQVSEPTPEYPTAQWYQPPVPEPYTPIMAPFAPTVEGRAAMEEYQAQLPPIEEIPPGLKAAIGAVGLEDWTVEEIEAYPLTPEGLIHPESPLFIVVTAPGEKIKELVETHTYVELREIGAAMPPMGPALPGIGEIKIEMPDILGGLKDVGKYALVAGAVILAAILFMRK